MNNGRAKIPTRKTEIRIHAGGAIKSATNSKRNKVILGTRKMGMRDTSRHSPNPHYNKGFGHQPLFFKDYPEMAFPDSEKTGNK